MVHRSNPNFALLPPIRLLCLAASIDVSHQSLTASAWLFSISLCFPSASFSTIRPKIPTFPPLFPRPSPRSSPPFPLALPAHPQFGLAFSYRTEAMTGSTHDPPNPSAVARVCYASAFVYAAFVVFCGCQVSPPAWIVSKVMVGLMHRHEGSC